MLIQYDMNDFNPNGGDFWLPPEGNYNLQIISEEINKKTGGMNGDYTYLNLTFKILDGEYRNRTFNMTYYTGHPNPVAAKIASTELAKIYYWSNNETMPPPNTFDTKDILNKSFTVDLNIDERPKTNGKEGTFKDAKFTNFKTYKGGNNTNQPIQQAQFNGANQMNQTPVGSPWGM